MTPKSSQPPNQQQPDRLIIEVEVATMKRLLHELGAHCPFNECYKDILVMTKFCEEAEAEYRDRQRSAVIDEAKLQAVTEYQASQVALNAQAKLVTSAATADAQAVRDSMNSQKGQSKPQSEANRSPAIPPPEFLVKA